jgi:hypothetical protein
MAKQGKTLTELAAELERQTTTRRDYVAPVTAITATVVNDPDGSDVQDVGLSGLNGGNLHMTDLAHQQVGEYTGIPKAYYDRMRTSHPDVLARDLNAWLGDKTGDKRLVRTLDGRVRAWLSNRYRPLDNYDLAQAVLPTLIAHKVEIISADVTERRLYIKGILTSLTGNVRDGLALGSGHDQAAPAGHTSVVVAAVTISNSEVGAGALRVEPSTFTTWCTNLAVLSEVAMRKYHVGRAFETDEDFTIFSDATRKADDVAFWMKVRDTVGAAFNEDDFRAAIARLQGAAETPIESDNLVRVVEMTTRTLGLSDGIRPNILTALARGGDMSKWGLAQAITSVANTAADYETATELEHAGGRVIDLTGRTWEAIAQAV